jgi:hypothetical protein
MLTPGSFHEILNANNSALNRKAVRQSTYTVKVLKQFRTSMRIPNECLDLFNNSNEQFPMDAFRSRMQHPLFNRLEIERIDGVTLGSLFNTDERNPALKRARTFDMLGGFGLVFPVEHYSDWIIHNMGSAEDKGLGNARIVIQSRLSDMPDVWIEPLKQFIRNMEGEK